MYKVPVCARYLAPCFTGLALQFFAPAVGNTVDMLAARCLPGGTSSPAGCAHPTAAGRARRGQAARPRCHQPVSGLHPRAARLEAGYEQGLPLAHTPPACTASADGAAPAGGASKEGRLGSVYGMLGEASRGNRLTHPTPPAACMAASSSASKENRPSNAAEAGSQAAPLPAPPATAHGHACKAAWPARALPSRGPAAQAAGGGAAVPSDAAGDRRGPFTLCCHTGCLPLPGGGFAAHCKPGLRPLRCAQPQAIARYANTSEADCSISVVARK